LSDVSWSKIDVDLSGENLSDRQEFHYFILYLTV